MRQAGLEAGIWRIPTAHGLPVYWCHVMQGEAARDLAPLPAEGFGCDTTEDAALAKALLEACQSRLGAIAGAREDVTAEFYRDGLDRDRLAAWRRQLGAGGAPLPADDPAAGGGLDRIVAAMGAAGARAAIVVPLCVDPAIPLCRRPGRGAAAQDATPRSAGMAGDIAVLLGPTLPVAEARTYLDAIYLPPAEQGSVFRAVLEHRPAVLAIIDGAFAQRPAVRHKEILWAMANGVEVHGAASMGALRAAELAAYGMVGHGFVYRWYRRTPLADDEEVAVAMAPAELGSAALGEALINMRLTLRRAERPGVVGRPVRAGARTAGARRSISSTAAMAR